MLELRLFRGSCGDAAGASELWPRLQTAQIEHPQTYLLKQVGCVGLCFQEPLVAVCENVSAETAAQYLDIFNLDPAQGVTVFLYGKVSPKDLDKILAFHEERQQRDQQAAKLPDGDLAVAPLEPAATMLRGDEEFNPPANLIWQSGQPLPRDLGQRVALENVGIIDPLSIDDYLARQGYQAIEDLVLHKSPEEVRTMVRTSGLKGRGGAGFLTAAKWDFAAAEPAPKYLICNGDEGDPGAFMDRSVLEGDPHRVIEGMMIAAYAIGASEGIAYIRAEYPQAIKHFEQAIQAAQERGFLGEHLWGSGFSFTLKVRQGAGAFVCGEETALIASLEGERGMPRKRPPFPAVKGFLNRPTIINNVETLANLPWIIRHSPESFAARGTENAKGTKVFALAGSITQGGLVEVNMGTPLKDVIALAGPTKSGLPIKAIQLGGPSGGCIPAALFATPVDYQAINATGAIMGSGGMIILDEGTCMVDLARYFLTFTSHESCGKCTFCRQGTLRMLEILERICQGQGKLEDLDLLQELAEKVRSTSLCGLGQTAPNPVLTTLRYFKDEYLAHINEHRCPAHQCAALITMKIEPSKCIGCNRCRQVCPAQAIDGIFKKKGSFKIDPAKCIRCGACLGCPVKAIEVI